MAWYEHVFGILACVFCFVVVPSITLIGYEIVKYLDVIHKVVDGD